MKIDASRALGGYAAVMTLAVIWLASTAIATPPTKFSTIDVERINVREPDGTLRMTISNHASMPGVIIAGKEHPNPNRTEAGMIFFNDQGDENGGLVFDGGLKNGRPTNGGSLTFDRYRQDQTVQLVSTEDGSDRRAGLIVNDRPDTVLDIDALMRARAMPPGAARQALLEKAGATGVQRAWLGRSPDNGVALVLKDAEGRQRLALSVDAKGNPLVEMRDAAGRVTKTIR